MRIFEAANALGISVTMLKKLLRKLNVRRWPPSKIQSVGGNADVPGLGGCWNCPLTVALLGLFACSDFHWCSSLAHK
jgi:hypothetical protein